MPSSVNVFLFLAHQWHCAALQSDGAALAAAREQLAAAQMTLSWAQSEREAAQAAAASTEMKVRDARQLGKA